MGPPATAPLLFRGRSEAGSVVEIRRKRSGELAVEIDGHPMERLLGDRAPLDDDRPAVVRLDGVPFYETFDVEAAAARALRRFRDSGGRPPREHASELLADGPIDVTFAPTARGRRALAAQTQQAP